MLKLCSAKLYNENGKGLWRQKATKLTWVWVVCQELGLALSRNVFVKQGLVSFQTNYIIAKGGALKQAAGGSC